MRHLDIDRNKVPLVPSINLIGGGHNDESHNDATIGDDGDDIDDDVDAFIVSPS